MKFFFLILTLGQLLMATTLHTLHVNNTDVTLIKEKDSRLPLITMQLIFQVSGSIEDGDKAGLAKLSAKLLGEGTKKLGSSKFAEALESKAIHISASTGTETFVIEMSCLKEQFDEALHYLKELLNDPNLTKEALQNVKIKTLGALEQKENNFDYIANINLKKILFANTPLANPANGTPQTIKKITLQDVQNFLSNHLVLSRAIVALGGDVDTKEEKKITALLRTLPKGELPQLPFYTASDAQNKLIEKKQTQQAYIYFGSPYNIRYNDPDTYMARVATFILGAGGFGSRLMEEIRVKKGLAYAAYTHLHVNKSSSYLSGYLQTKLDSQDEALKTVKEVLRNFVQNGVTQEELDQTKKFILGSEPLRNETMSQRLNRAFMEYYKGFSLGHSKEELEKVKKLSLQEFNNFIHHHKEILQISISIVTQ